MKLLILGASGLTGGFCLQHTLQHEGFSHIYTLSRRELPVSHPKLQQIIATPEQAVGRLPQVDACICCLGTTMKKAGSREAFRKVDYEYPMLLAKALKEQACKQWILVSAVGASTQSSFFYFRVKGELERDLASLQFDSLWIARPGLLTGNRNEQRTGEDFAKAISPVFDFLMQGSLSRYRSIHASDLAKALCQAALAPLPGKHTTEGTALQQYARAFKV